MPDPIVSPLAMAEQAKLITADDAAYLNREAARRGVDPTTLGGDLKPLREAWDKQSDLDRWKSIAQNPRLAYALAQNNRAQLVQNEVERVIQWNAISDATKYIEPAGVFDAAGLTIRTSLRMGLTGLASIRAAIDSVPYVFSDEPSPYTRLGDFAISEIDAENEQAADIQYRSQMTAGSRHQIAFGSILGKIPEMLATGFGAGALAKGLVSTSISRTLLGVATNAPKLAPTQIKAIVAGTAFIQGGTEAAQVTVDRMGENMNRGRELFTASDLTVAATTLGVVMLTEAFGGVGAEVRQFAGRAGRSAWRDAGKDLLVQPAQEAVQEFVQSVVTDVADYKQINWNEAGWGAFYGAVAGTAFAMPQIARAMFFDKSPSEVTARQDVIKAAADMLQAKPVAENVKRLEEMRTTLGQMEVAKRMDLAEYRKFLVETSGNNTSEQHFDLADFAAIAEKKGMTAEDLTVAWGGKTENGTVSIPTVFLASELRDEQAAFVGQVYDAVRDEPGRMNLKEIADKMPEMEKRFADIEKAYATPTLPDGTKDDSAEIVDELAKQITDTGTKIAKTHAKATAMLQAELVRTAAIRFNEAYAKAGLPRRVTPKEVWNGVAPEIRAGDDVPTVSLEQPNRGNYDPIAKIIRLGKKADVTTINHELMHHWIETTRAWAQMPEAPPAFREDLEAFGKWAAANAKSVVAHAAKSEIATTEDAVRDAAADMVNLNLNSKAGRAIHESMTGAFEEYIAKGKAPTEGLRGAFARMATAFKRIYHALIAANATGVPLLNDDVAASFDRMIRAQDRVAPGYLVESTAESLGISDETFDVVATVKADAINAAAVKVEALMRSMVKAQTEKVNRDTEATVRSEVEREPVYRARVLLLDKKLDADSVAMLVKDKPQVLADLGQYTGKNGVNPEDLALEAGFNDVTALLDSLATAPTLDATVAERTEKRLDDAAMSEEDQLEELRASAEGRAKVSVAEYRATKDAVRAAKTEGKVVAKAAKAQSKEEIAAIREEWKEKARRVAERAKLEKVGWAADSGRLLRQMKENFDAQIQAGAEYRDQTERKTPKELESALLAATQKVTKLATGGDFEAALIAYWEVETLAAQARLTAERDVAQVKEAAKAAKAFTLSAVRAKADADLAMLTEIAERRVSRMAAMDLKVGRAARLADAARRRKEKAIAEQNPQAIMDESYNIAAADIMEAAVLRAIASRQRIAARMNRMLLKPNLVALEASGMPSIAMPDGTVQSFPSWDAAERQYRLMGSQHSGAALRPGNDLGRVATAINDIMSDGSRAEGNASLQDMVDNGTEGSGVLLSWFLNKMVRNGRLNPKEWTLLEWEAVERQLMVLETERDRRPTFMDQHDKLAKEMRDAANAADAKPPKQRKDMGDAVKFANYVARVSGKLMLTHLRKLGKPGLAMVESSRDAEAALSDLIKDAQNIIAPARKAFTRAERKVMDATVVSHGIQTNGWERIVRVMQWGTESGRQRVMDDLALRFENAGVPNASQEFLRDLFKSLTAKEIALVEAMWKANELVWVQMDSAAQRNGIPSAGKLNNLAFDVLVDGKVQSLSGGYAAVPYAVDDFGMDLLDASGNFRIAGLDINSLKARSPRVKDRLLKLDLDAQFGALLNKARTASYADFAKKMSAVFSDRALMGTLTAKFGEDWVTDLKGYVRHAVDGLAGKEEAPSFIRRALTFGVYGLNMMTAPLQTLGVINAAGHPAIGNVAMAQATIDFYKSRGQLGREMARKSRMLRLRTHSGQDVDYRSPQQTLGELSLRDKVQSIGVWPMQFFQWWSDVPTWTAAYRVELGKASAEGVDADVAEARAIAKADEVLLETQGSSYRTDQAEINRAEWGRIVTFSGKWMINNSNMLRRMASRAGAEKGWPSKLAFAKAVLYSTLLSSAALAAVRALLRPEDDDEEQRDFGDYAARVGQEVFTSPHWALNTIVPPLYEMFLGETEATNYRSSGSMVWSMGRDYYDFARQMALLVDSDKEADPAKVLGSAVGAGSLWFPIPAVQLKRVIKAGSDDWESGWESFVAGIFGKESTPIRQ